MPLIHDLEDLPGGEEYGGVLTPASGLGEPLINRLQANEVYFEGPLDENLEVPQEKNPS